jgi:hypothetical protein
MAKRRVLIVAGIIGTAALLWFVVGFTSAQTACAHDPRFACSPRGRFDPIRIHDPEKSWAFYGRLGNDERDHYLLIAREPLHVPWQLLIERRDAGDPLRPSAVVRDEHGRQIASLSLSGSDATTFYEPFSRITYLSTIPHVLRVPPGRYEITISMRGAGPPQRYVMAIGEQERFGLGEIPYVIGAIHRIDTRGW